MPKPAAAFNQQFERTNASPEVERVKHVVDGEAALKKFSEGGVPAIEMTGGEMFAIINTLKAQQQAGIDALDLDLLKIKRQPEKKETLMAWVSENVRAVARPEVPKLALPPAPLTARPANNEDPPRPTTAPPLTDRPDPKKRKMPVEPAPLAPPPCLSDDEAVPLVQAFIGGKDAMKMTGAEYHGLIGWLKKHGEDGIEDQLMRVRLLGDKKVQLVGYVQKHGARISASVAEAPAPAPVADVPMAAEPEPAMPMAPPVAPPVAQPMVQQVAQQVAQQQIADPAAAVQRLENTLQVGPPVGRTRAAPCPQCVAPSSAAWLCAVAANGGGLQDVDGDGLQRHAAGALAARGAQGLAPVSGVYPLGRLDH